MLVSEPASAAKEVPLPDTLRAIYGPLALAAPILYANFVQTIDGVVALEELPASEPLISAHSHADHFLMGLLRACAHVVLIGAGTLRAGPRHRWTAEHIFPRLAPEFAELRRRLELPPHPALAVLTASGRVDLAHGGFVDGSLVITSGRGREALGRARTPRIEVLSEESNVDIADVIAFLINEGFLSILSEAGPTVMGQLIDRRLLDDLFLTVSPVLAGRPGGSRRLGLVEGIGFLPERSVELQLGSLRRHGEHLFLRYRRVPQPPAA
ncbi:MAG TPA: dihydrofolate reductase family protein [Candidatus Sulfotelmatobacter sp.]|nr:dihydrofolate reductase family protein [Candidatus Sulfotelmatobacter sp.]